MIWGSSYANLNEVYSSLLNTSSGGMKMYCLQTFQVYYENGLKYVSMAERINARGVMAVVFNHSPCCLNFILAENCEELHVKAYPEEILALKVNKKVLAVCLRSAIYVHGTNDLEVVMTVDSIPMQCRGLCAIPTMIVKSDRCYLAYPCSPTTGTVRIVEVFTKCDIVTVVAHDSNIAAIAMNPQQTMIATASVKGTVIRVISIPVGRRLYEFRRGLQRSSVIYSLSFSSDSTFLCCSGSTGTIHIFKLLPPSSTKSGGWMSSVTSMVRPFNRLIGGDTDMTKETRDDRVEKAPRSWSSTLVGGLTSTASYASQQICRTACQDRSFARAKLPRSGLANISIIEEATDQSGKVYAVCEDGYLFCFTFDIVNGGECIMQNQCRVMEFKESLIFLEGHRCFQCRHESLRSIKKAATPHHHHPHHQAATSRTKTR